MRPHQTHGEAHARRKLHNLTSHMVNNSYRNVKRSATFTSKLPIELLQHVFVLLPAVDLARLSATCKYLREVCLEDG
jgi:F-box-like